MPKIPFNADEKSIVLALCRNTFVSMLFRSLQLPWLGIRCTKSRVLFIQITQHAYFTKKQEKALGDIAFRANGTHDVSNNNLRSMANHISSTRETNTIMSHANQTILIIDSRKTLSPVTSARLGERCAFGRAFSAP